MEEYVRLIASVKNALQQRSDKKAEYLASLTDVEAKQIAHNKVALAASKEDQASIKLVSRIAGIVMKSISFVNTTLQLRAMPCY